MIPLISITHEGFNFFVYDYKTSKHFYIEDELVGSWFDTNKHNLIDWININNNIDLTVFNDKDFILKVLNFKFKMISLCLEIPKHYTDLNFIYGDVTSKEIVKYCLQQNFYKSYKYLDNFRITKIGNEEEEELYNMSRKKGCCGYYDEIITIRHVKFKIGFNYGH